MMKFNSWVTLKGDTEVSTDEQEIDVTVEIDYIFLGAAATRFDPEEDPYLEFTVKDAQGNDITKMLDDYSSERIADECFDWYRDYWGNW
jgi:hypothetical protein